MKGIRRTYKINKIIRPIDVPKEEVFKYISSLVKDGVSEYSGGLRVGKNLYYVEWELTIKAESRGVCLGDIE